MEWYIKVLKNYVGFQGRARRKEYWMFALVNGIITIILSVILGIMDLSPVASLYSLAVLLPSLAVGIRRLHDTNRTGWWLLISLIPGVGFIILIIFMCFDSDPSINQYGENPKL